MPRSVTQLLIAALTAILALASVGALANPCVWSFTAQEGKSAYHTLTPKWTTQCPEPIKYSVVSGNAAFPDSTSNRLLFSPAVTGNAGTKRYEEVKLSVTCQGADLCAWAVVYFVINPAGGQPTTMPPTSAPPTTEPPTSAPPTTEPPQQHLTCANPNTLSARVGVSTPLELHHSVQGCAAPSFSITSQTGRPSFTGDAFTVAADGSDVIFDKDGANTREGVFTAHVHVSCAASGETCEITQMVVADATLTTSPAPELPDCASPYLFRTAFGATLHDTVVVHPEDAALCPSGSAAPTFVFSDVTRPQYNPESFQFAETTGAFSYLAPEGPQSKQDAFTFVVRCGEAGSPASNTAALCKAHASIMIAEAVTPTPSPTPSPTPAPEVVTCPGNYDYRLALNADGTASAKEFSLLSRFTSALGPESAFCPDGAISTVVIKQTTTRGTITSFDDATGRFEYTPAASAAASATPEDTFTFSLTCATTASSVCEGTANILIDPAPSNTVYHLHNDTITCRGTCDAKAWKSTPDSIDGFFETDPSPLGDKSHITPRKDDRELDGLDFSISDDGKLIMRAYATIGNLAARFVTVSPITSSEPGAFTSAAVPDGSHVSFDPSCLDRQANYGLASDIWQWTDKQQLKGHLNTDTNAYKSGDNYFQKFGGNHRECDVYRADPCKYAPLMTPTVLNESSTNIMQWRLFINDCDATWVGEASVETLRALRLPDGSPAFRLVNTNQLEGYVYSQAVKPSSWRPPYKGVVTSQRQYKLSLTIMNTLIIDVAPQLVTTAGDVEMSSDIQFALASDPKSNERIYAYHLVFYPYYMNNDVLTAVDTATTKIASYTFVNATWRSPSAIECPECTGTDSFCKGTGNGLETDCPAPLLTLEPLDEKTITFDTSASSVGGSNLFPSTSFSSRSSYHIYLAARANGRGSADSTDGTPVGTFYLEVTLSNNQRFTVLVNQTDYVSEINTRFIGTRLYRPTAYWPVPDALGSSVPIHPFNATTAGLVAGPESEETPAAAASPYGGPIPLSTSCLYAWDESDERTHVQLEARTNKIGTQELSMVAAEDARTYGVTDWVLLSFPSIHEETSNIHDSLKQQVIEDPTLSDNYYTVARLEYLTLSVSAKETIVTSEDEALLHFMLDGRSPPQLQLNEELEWMQTADAVDPSAPPAKNVEFLPWYEYASFINYRRISFTPKTDTSKNIVVEPFNFAFIPGTLLYLDSNVRVPFYVRGSIKFTTFAEPANGGTEPVKVSEREEQLYYVLSVSRGISAAVRFDNDSYVPELVTVRSSGLGRTSATALLIVLVVCIVVVLAAATYVEFTYRRIIHNAKYHPKRPESAVGIRYGRDGKPKNADATILNDDDDGTRSRTSTQGGGASSTTSARTKKPSAAAAAAAKGETKTEFGVIGKEQPRVRDEGDGEGGEGTSAVSDRKTTSNAGADANHGEIGSEQERASDSSVAEF